MLRAYCPNIYTVILLVICNFKYFANSSIFDSFSSRIQFSKGPIFYKFLFLIQVETIITAVWAFGKTNQTKQIHKIILSIYVNWSWMKTIVNCQLSLYEFAQFCQKVKQRWLLSQRDSGLKSESSESVSFIEKNRT